MSLKKLLTIAMVTMSVTSFAQNVGVNADGSIPDNSAMLDIKSTGKGVLIPRMSMNDRGLIPLPATGLLIYQTDNTPGFYYNSGTSALPVWTMISSAGAVQGTANGVLVGQGTGNPSTFTPASTANNQFLSTPTAGGMPMWTTPSDVTGTGVVNVVNGTGQGVGTGNTSIDITGTSGGVLYGTGASSAFSGAGTTGQVLVSNGSAAPSWAAPNTTLTTSSIVGTNVVAVTNGAGQAVGTGNVSLNVVGTQGGVLYGTGTSSSFTGAATVANQVLATPVVGSNPAWISANSALTTSNIVPATSSAVVVTNGSNQVVGSTPVSVDVQGTLGGVMYGTGANPATFTAAGTAGQFLKSNGTTAPTWTTPKARFSVPCNHSSGATALNSGTGSIYGGPVSVGNVASPVGLTTYFAMLGACYQATSNVESLGCSGWIYNTSPGSASSFIVTLYRIVGLYGGACSATQTTSATVASSSVVSIGSCTVNFSTTDGAGHYSIDVSNAPVALSAGDGLMLHIVNNSGSPRVWYGVGTADLRANVQ